VLSAGVPSHYHWHIPNKRLSSNATLRVVLSKAFQQGQYSTLAQLQWNFSNQMLALYIQSIPNITPTDDKMQNSGVFKDTF